MPAIVLLVAICLASSVNAQNGEPAAVHAQDGLVGTWSLMTGEEDQSALLIIKEDGTAVLTVVDRFGPELVSVSFGNGEPAELPDTPFFTEGFSVRFVVAGSWEVTGTQFSFSAADLSVSYNGLNEEDFWEALDRELADLPAQGQESIGVQIHLERLLEIYLELAEGTETSLNGDTLLITDKDGFETEYLRVDGITVTTLAASSWGRMKAAAAHPVFTP